MIVLRNKNTNEVSREYQCTKKTLVELCLANVECLLHIALADSDKHIRKLGGEAHLLELMNGYMDLVGRIKKEFKNEV